MKMMNNLLGIGTDIIEIDRIEDSINRFGDQFLTKLFTPEEIAYCKKHKFPSKHFAGRFAAKEAIAKAIGSGFGENLSWLDIEILPNEQKKPIAKCKDYLIQLSISHCQSYAVAMAMVFIKD